MLVYQILPPMRRDEWVAGFVDGASRLWPTMSPKHATSVGLFRYRTAHKASPEKAARAWIVELKAAAAGQG
jgi:hypothetical protein